MKSVFVEEDKVEIQHDYMRKLREMLGNRRENYYIDTYGCQQNEADSERIAGMLEQSGYHRTENENEADVLVVNSCAVRGHAEMRILGNVGALSHIKRRNPNAVLVLCGCMAGEPNMVERLKKSFPYVDIIFSPDAIWRFPELLHRKLTGAKRVYAVENKDYTIAEGLPVSRKDTLKAYVSIMYGCDNFCAYCIVPYTRGRERSRRPEDVIAEVKCLVENGCRDITLLGQNVNSYGKYDDFNCDFADLLQRLSEIPGEFLLRFMTSHPKDASRKLIDVMASSPKIAKCLHLPFQSGSDRILKIMNRHYDREKYLSIVDYAREKMPDIVLTSDVIVGFPGETDEDFEKTISLVERVGYDALFTFIFSPREGTPAAKMDDPFTKGEKQVHFDRLLAVQNAISEQKHAEYIGKTVRVLVDGVDHDDASVLTSRTNGNRLVRVKADKSLIGRFITVKITGSTMWSLTGEPVFD